MVSFNPCFNGQLTQTGLDDFLKVTSYKRFNPCFNGQLTQTITEYGNLRQEAGFNPCFNGQLTQTFGTRELSI